MKILLRLFLGLHVWMYRMTNGRFGGEMRGFKVLILTTKGRKSGRILHTPLGYFERDGGYYIVASNAGGDKNPAWYHNIKGNPGDVSIQVNERKIKVTPQVVSGEPRRQVYDWIASLAPNYAEYEKSTKREIPLLLLKG